MFKINYNGKKIYYFCFGCTAIFCLYFCLTDSKRTINIFGALFASLIFAIQISYIFMGVLYILAWMLEKIGLCEFIAIDDKKSKDNTFAEEIANLENKSYFAQRSRITPQKATQNYFSEIYIPKPTIGKVPPVEEIMKPSPRRNNIEWLQKMDWRQFEIYISKILERHGYKTQVTPAQNDEGKDIIATKDNVTYFIECKHYTSGTLIGREALQKLCGAAVPYNVKRLIFITLSGYNSNAIEYAKKVNATEDYKLTLLQTEEILKMAKEVNLL